MNFCIDDADAAEWAMCDDVVLGAKPKPGSDHGISDCPMNPSNSPAHWIKGRGDLGVYGFPQRSIIFGPCGDQT